MVINIKPNELGEIYAKIQTAQENYERLIKEEQKRRKVLESYLNELHSIILNVDDNEDCLKRLKHTIKEWACEDLPF